MGSKKTRKGTSCFTMKSIWFEQYHIFHPSSTKCAFGTKQHTYSVLRSMTCFAGNREARKDSNISFLNFCCLPVKNIPNQHKSLIKRKLCSSGAKFCIAEPSTNAKSWSEIMLVNEAEPASASSSSFELRVILWSAHWTSNVGPRMPRMRSKRCNIINVVF